LQSLLLKEQEGKSKKENKAAIIHEFKAQYMEKHEHVEAKR